MQEQILGMDKEMFSWMCTLIIVPLAILILSVIYFINEKRLIKKSRIYQDVDIKNIKIFIDKLADDSKYFLTIKDREMRKEFKGDIYDFINKWNDKIINKK